MYLCETLLNTGQKVCGYKYREEVAKVMKISPFKQGY